MKLRSIILLNLLFVPCYIFASTNSVTDLNSGIAIGTAVLGVYTVAVRALPTKKKWCVFHNALKVGEFILKLALGISNILNVSKNAQKN